MERLDVLEAVISEPSKAGSLVRIAEWLGVPPDNIGLELTVGDLVREGYLYPIKALSGTTRYTLVYGATEKGILKVETEQERLRS